MDGPKINTDRDASGHVRKVRRGKFIDASPPAEDVKDVSRFISKKVTPLRVKEREIQL